MNPDAPDIADTIRRRRLPTWTWWGLVVLLAAAGFFGYFWYVHEQDVAKLRQTIAEISAEEPGWTLAELEAAREFVADEENSALVIASIGERIPIGWDIEGIRARAFGFPTNLKLDEKAADRLAKELAKIAEEVEWARKINDLPRGRFVAHWTGEDWFWGSAGFHGSPIKWHVELPERAIDILFCDAFLLCHNGKFDQATRNCVGMINAGNSVGQDPLDFSHFLQCNGMSRAAYAVERILSHGEPSEACLLELQQKNQSQLTQPITLDWLLRDRALLHQCILEASEKRWKHRRYYFPGLCSARSHALVLQIYSESAAIARTNPQSPFLPLRDYLDSQFNTAKAVRTTIGNRDRPLARVNEETLDFLTEKLGSLRSDAERIAHSRAMLMCANVAIAAERFRRKQGSWPKGPEQLVPAYLPEWPNDPFDDHPLRYKRHASGKLTIYSVGPNGMDDGGKLDRKKSRKEEPDIGLELFPPNERGLQPEDE